MKGPMQAMSAGEACLRGLLVTAVAATPSALRTWQAGASFWGGLVVGAAVLLPIVTLSMILLRAAGRGFRGVFGKSAGNVAPFGIALWMGLSIAALAGLAAWLKATTHHRGLGGATFGVLALVAVAACAVIAFRMVRAGQWLVARGVPPWVVAALGAACGVLPVLFVAAPIAKAPGAPGASQVGAAIIDGAISLVATALVASLDLGESLRPPARRFGLALGLVVFSAGFIWLERSDSLGRAIRAAGGLPAAILDALEQWTDRDKDGSGAHFGGRDCDEGDPRLHPGAPEIPGDGIDQDCDRVDPPVAHSSAAAARAAPASSGVPAQASALAAPADAPLAPPSRPDILLVTLDTVRADHTSLYGYARDTTPHLKQLAKRGVVFEHAYAAASDTQRALMPLVSGRSLEETARDRREWPTVLAEVDTVAERIGRAGYATAAVTSFTWLSEERGFAQGFERFHPVYGEGAHPERSVTGDLAARAAERILVDLATEARPIFLWVHLFDAHERYLEHPGGIHFGKGRTARYDGEIAFVDQKLGDLMAAVSKSPRASRTAWIVHGSHGEGLGEHDILGHGSQLYEEAIRVPLVIALPDGPPGNHQAGAVSTFDVVKTVLSLAEAPADATSGSSLLEVTRGHFSLRFGPVLARGPRRSALIDWPLKLIVIERKRSNRVLLFDLDNDPAEARNLSESSPADAARLMALLPTLAPAEK